MRADGRETGLFEPRGQFFDCVGALVVFFKIALPRAVRLEAEEVDLVVEHFDVFSVARAPEAEHVLTLVEQHLAVEFFHF